MTVPRRALLSVWDKTGIEDFARSLSEMGFEILSTGGTAKALREAGLAVLDVSEVTGHPEIMGGRVKTLHPAIHGGILARRDVAGDMEALEAQGYRPIDVVAVNLYPFRETIAAGGVPVAAAMKQVDIGGPTMIRAAAKNHAHVWVVVDPADYARVVAALEGEAFGPGLRRELAAKVFRHTSAYDEAITRYLSEDDTTFPEMLTPAFRKVSSLRYGENPDQEAAFYAVEGEERQGIASLTQHHGKELSYNNLLDIDGALLALSPFAFSPRPAVAIVKHTTPCGLGVGESAADAFARALRTDPTSAFGSVIAFNRTVDRAAAEAIGDLFAECLVAPDFSDEAMEILSRRKNVRILTFPEQGGELDVPRGAEEALAAFESRFAGDEPARRAARFLAEHGRQPEPVTARGIYGGLLLQSSPTPPFLGAEDSVWRVVTKRRPTDEEMNDLEFAWAAVYGIKSNAILLARDGATLGIGAGQMSRVDSSRLAVQKAADAGLELAGAVLASDAFFPFRDAVDAAVAAGVRAIVQPGGSVRDEEVIGAADEAGIAMVFTGRRLFRH
ncbi:MAG: bifunctional phosphoribosylaminoimidazolecarboxamide formyltransferase/IMP cyclohydrolase [Gemmatimonadota bacterium]